MGETEKQRRVCRFYKRFSELCDVIPSSTFEIWEDTPHDPPDVCVGDYELGIEFTEFYHDSDLGGSEMKAREAAFERIVALAKTKFEEQYPTPLSVQFFWSNNRPAKSQFPALADAIVDLLYKQLPIENSQIIRLGWDDFSSTCLRPYLHSVRMLAWPSLTVGHWANTQAGWPDTKAESFVPLVREKERDLPKYPRAFRSVWLVIVTDGSGISSTVIPDETLGPGCISSEFDRVYFFDAFTSTIILLTEDKG